jgi:hypothetical protein
MSRDKEFANWTKTDKTNMSPCPMLNTLKNYNVLPGKQITPDHMRNALYALKSDAVLANVLALILKISFGTACDLNVIGTHNVLEHDASLTREDYGIGDHVRCSKKRLHKMMSYSTDGKYLKLNELAAYYKYQKRQSELNNKHCVFTRKHFIAGLGERSVLFGLLRDQTGHVPLKWLKYFFLKEKLPFEDGFELKPLLTSDLIDIACRLCILEYFA